MRSAYNADRVKDGVFGAMMACSLTNDGPVTLQLDSRKYIYVDPESKPTSSKKPNEPEKLWML